MKRSKNYLNYLKNVQSGLYQTERPPDVMYRRALFLKRHLTNKDAGGGCSDKEHSGASCSQISILPEVVFKIENIGLDAL